MVFPASYRVNSWSANLLGWFGIVDGRTEQAMTEDPNLTRPPKEQAGILLATLPVKPLNSPVPLPRTEPCHCTRFKSSIKIRSLTLVPRTHASCADQRFPLCNLSVLCVSVVVLPDESLTTETWSTQRLHRDEQGRRLIISQPASPRDGWLDPLRNRTINEAVSQTSLKLHFMVLGKTGCISSILLT